MKLSIIIPVYNVEKYLNKCVDSLIAQNLVDTEILLIDDGSPDGCGKICDEYAEKYDFIKSYHKKNGGLSDARNYGIKQAQGDYIIFIDSDDYVNEQFKKIYSYLNDNFDAILFGWDVETLKSNYTINNQEQKILSKYEIYKGLEICSKKNSACIKAINRNFLLKNNLFFENGFAEDFGWTGRLFCHLNTYRITNLSYYHYIAERQGSIMNVYKKQRFYDIINHARSIKGEMDKMNVDIKLRDLLDKYIGFNVVRTFRNVSKLNKQDRKEVLALLRQNQDLVKKQGTLITKMFVLFSNIFGFDIMYKVVK